MILQPVVEKYSKHGFDNRQKDACINIITRVEAGKLHIVVEDNGKGMEPALLDELNAQLAETSNHFDKDIRTGQVGLRNVSSRLQLYFGDEASLELYPRDPRGLAVEITLPAYMEEGGSDHEGVDRR